MASSRLAVSLLRSWCLPAMKLAVVYSCLLPACSCFMMLPHRQCIRRHDARDSAAGLPKKRLDVRLGLIDEIDSAAESERLDKILADRRKAAAKSDADAAKTEPVEVRGVDVDLSLSLSAADAAQISAEADAIFDQVEGVLNARSPRFDVWIPIQLLSH